MTRKWNTTKWNFNHAGNVHYSDRDCPRQRYWDILPYFSKKSHCYFEMTNFYHWNLIRICAILELVWNSPIVLQVQAYPCSEVIMSAMASQITGVLIVCLNVCSVADRRKHQSSMSLAFVRGIHRWQVNSPHKGPVTRKMFPFDDVIMEWKSFGEMGPRTLRQPNLRKVRRPTVPWKGRNESPLIDIHSSIKAIHQSVIDIMDIHNSNMDVYNPVMYIHNTITNIQTCRNSYGYPWLNCGCQ